MCYDSCITSTTRRYFTYFIDILVLAAECTKGCEIYKCDLDHFHWF